MALVFLQASRVDLSAIRRLNGAGNQMPFPVLKKILVFSIFAVAAGTAVFMATKGSPDKPGSAPPADTTSAAKPEPVITPEDEIHEQYAGSASCK